MGKRAKRAKRVQDVSEIKEVKEPKEFTTRRILILAMTIIIMALSIFEAYQRSGLEGVKAVAATPGVCSEAEGP